MKAGRLSRSQVAEQLANKTGLSVEQVKSVLQAQAELAYDNAEAGFAVPGIGVLSKIERPERQMKMIFGPKKGEIVTLPRRKSVSFRLSPLAKARVLDRSLPTPDLFETIQITDFKFSTEGTKLPDTTTLAPELGAPYTSRQNGHPVPVSFYQLPNLHLPSGRIVVSDGIISMGGPLQKSVRPGTYPLFLGVAGMGGDERVALAIIRFSGERITSWESALLEEREDGSRRGATNTYGVDSGTGSFRDESVQELIDEAHDVDIGLDDQMLAESQKVRRTTWTWVHVETRNGSMAVFSSGYGDGAYGSWFGIGESGEPVALVTDFGIVRWAGAQ